MFEKIEIGRLSVCDKRREGIKIIGVRLVPFEKEQGSGAATTCVESGACSASCFTMRPRSCAHSNRPPSSPQPQAALPSGYPALPSIDHSSSICSCVQDTRELQIQMAEFSRGRLPRPFRFESRNASLVILSNRAVPQSRNDALQCKPTLRSNV